MFGQNNLQKLYPHLRFDRLPQVGRERSVSTGRSTVIPKQPLYQAVPKPPEELKNPPSSQKPSEKIEKTPTPQISDTITEPKKPSKSQKKPEEVPKPDPPKKVKSVQIQETPIEAPQPTKPKVEKPKPVRESQLPQKGERGLQKRYTLEQKREMYLNQLSRKSVKRAEQEVARVNQVLNEVEHDPAKLKLEERKVKGRLKLINVAKYFAHLSDDKAHDVRVKTSEPKKLKENKIDSIDETSKHNEVLSEEICEESLGEESDASSNPSISE